MVKRNRKRGFSMVEAIIALSVIVVVSVSATTILIASVGSAVRAVNRTHAQNFADGMWESFKVSDTKEEFISHALFAEGVDLGEGVTEVSGRTQFLYRSEERKFTALVTVYYPEGARPEFSVEIENEDGDGLISFSYTKSSNTL